MTEAEKRAQEAMQQHYASRQTGPNWLEEATYMAAFLAGYDEGWKSGALAMRQLELELVAVADERG